jgi:hypothetical protein
MLIVNGEYSLIRVRSGRLSLLYRTLLLMWPISTMQQPPHSVSGSSIHDVSSLLSGNWKGQNQKLDLLLCTSPPLQPSRRRNKPNRLFSHLPTSNTFLELLCLSSFTTLLEGKTGYGVRSLFTVLSYSA